MELVYENGKRAYLAGYKRHANPVSYIGANGLYSTAQAALRDAWFAGWDSEAA